MFFRRSSQILPRIRFLLCLAFLASAVQAAPHMQEVEATRFSRIDVQIQPGAFYTFRTADLPVGGDTELRLVSLAHGEQGHNDNDPFGNLSSELSYFSTILTGPFQLYVLAHQGTPAGDCRVIIEEDDVVIFDQVVAFGGTTVAVPPSSQTETHNYSAVIPPNGIEDPILLGLGQWGAMLAMHDDMPYSKEAWILGVSGIHRVVVGTLGTPGQVRILANDVWADSDGDNIGPGLEAEMGSCDSFSDPGCHLVFNLQDSDRDSIPDYTEILGSVLTTPPLFFPRWGASPAHKDVFVEVDYADQFASQPFNEAHAVELQAIYDDGPAGQLMNLDGLPGIRLHFDAGVPASVPQNATLIGQWGGSNQRLAGSSFASNIARNRDHLFFHGIIDSGGQSFGRTFGVGLSGSTPRAQIMTFAHELGHSLGLTHEGHPSWGYNCSPIYNSIMNYAGPAFGPQRGFALDTDFPGVVLNPTFLCEAKGLGGGDVSHLAGWGIPTQGQAVDWNRDGVIQDCGTPVRSAINFWPPSGCAAHVRGEENLAKGFAPSLSKMGSWMYSFYIDFAGDISYRRGLMYSDARESGCPNGYAVEGGETCTDWEPPATIPMDGPVADLNTYSVDGLVHVMFRFINSPGIFLMTASSHSATGALTGWTGPTLLAGVNAKRVPDMAVVYVDQAIYGTERLVMAIWPDEVSSELMWSAYDPASGVSFSFPKPVVDDQGQTLVTNDTRPTMVHWGADAGYFSEKEGTFMVFPAQADSQIVLYGYDPQADAWLDLTANALPVRPSGKIEQPIGFGWRPLVAADGSVLDPLKGEFFLTYGATNEGGVGSTWFSQVVDAQRPPISDLTFDRANAGRFGHPWYGVMNQGGGMDYYTDPDFPYVKALFINGNTEVTFLPHPDGIYDKDFQVGSDWWIMERGICMTLRNGDTSWCGGPNAFGY